MQVNDVKLILNLSMHSLCMKKCQQLAFDFTSYSHCLECASRCPDVLAALDELLATNLSAPVQRKRQAPTVQHQVEDAICEEDSCHHIPCLDSVEQYEETENFDP